MSRRLSKVRSDITHLRGLFDLTRDGLGKDLCKAATDGVQATIAAEQAPDGTPWDELSAGYEEWKSFQFPGSPIAVLHGTMADPREVAGVPTVASDFASVTYGVSEQARQEAVWFQEGDENQPGRPFFGLTEASRARILEILDGRFATFR